MYRQYIPDGTPDDDFSDVGPERAPRLLVNTNPDPSENDPDNPDYNTDKDQERCPSCGDVLTTSGPAVCAACAEGGACTVCAGPHYAYHCPSITAALRAEAPNPGRAIWQHSHRRAPHFYDTLRRLDMSIWQVLAQACAAYEGVPTEAVLDRWLLGVQGTNVPAKAA